MALVKIADDVWIQTDLIISVEKNATTGATEISYFAGSAVVLVSVTGTTVAQVVEKIKTSAQA